MHLWGCDNPTVWACGVNTNRVCLAAEGEGVLFMLLADLFLLGEPRSLQVLIKQHDYLLQRQPSSSKVHVARLLLECVECSVGGGKAEVHRVVETHMPWRDGIGIRYARAGLRHPAGIAGGRGVTCALGGRDIIEADYAWSVLRPVGDLLNAWDVVAPHEEHFMLIVVMAAKFLFSASTNREPQAGKIVKKVAVGIVEGTEWKCRGICIGCWGLA
ncbi:hypothetical protein B0T14DRAFT_190816 [Immersiella caudata]|uniref:Uncharacterized protein n=1 Tax=Immersiella caudata TaxID=314043 RepID=A0AA40C3D9_9PEZI|nr:hypothetical protein B0T14DRAFT_190816 [Immersiella caudata]